MAKSKSPFGDVRIAGPFTKLLTAMSEKMTVILRLLGNDRKKDWT
jgi:hypothetical protein